MFYLINKPTTWTSFDIIRKFRSITGIKKVGHTGTLDPLASGALLLATDNSTKLISRIEKETKTYLFTVDMSLSSPSLDLEWDIISVDISSMKNHTNEEIQRFLLSQTSEIPPKYSAIHISGKRAYDLIRKGVEFDIAERPLSISSVIVVEQSLPRITIRITISAGWYIRSLAPVIARFFGVTDGGCITSLHREKIWSLDLRDSMTIDAIDLTHHIAYSELFSSIDSYILDIIHQKRLIDGLIVPVGTLAERSSWAEILIYCWDMCSLWVWTDEGIKVIKNYV